MQQYFVYILFNKPNGTLYVGVTNDLKRRIYEHKNKVIAGFTSKYNVDKLGYFEITDNIESAIMREKQLKSGSRAKKIALITSVNKSWQDLYTQI